MNSGQVFLWEYDGGFWYGIDGQNVLKCDSTGIVESCRGGTVADFFRTGDDVARITKSISRDAAVRRAVSEYPGLRLTRQDPFQCCITFIASSNSSIQKIKTSLQRLCRRFGKRAEFDGSEFFLFPEPGAVAGASLGEVRECGFGYRSRYLVEAAEMIRDGAVDFGRARKLGYHEAKSMLLAMPGVGDKVADCILLFSLDKLEAFPLDRWVLKVLQSHYPEKFDAKAGSMAGRRYDATHDKIVEYFGPYAGYAQQFLFKMVREQHGKRWL